MTKRADPAVVVIYFRIGRKQSIKSKRGNRKTTRAPPCSLLVPTATQSGTRGGGGKEDGRSGVRERRGKEDGRKKDEGKDGIEKKGGWKGRNGTIIGTFRPLVPRTPFASLRHTHAQNNNTHQAPQSEHLIVSSAPPSVLPNHGEKGEGRKEQRERDRHP